MSAFRLTSYQQSFVDRILAGDNPSDAYRNSLYKSDGWSKAAIAVAASRLQRHANIALSIERGRKKVSRKIEYGLEKAVEMALDDWAQAKELGQIGAAVSSNRLAADLLGLLVERKRDLNAEEDPINKLLGDLAGHSRTIPRGETTH